MRPGAHIKAAIEVLGEILLHHRPVAAALADWGKSHRFAGSGDRAAIGNLVYDALRRKRSLAARMGSDEPRAIILAAAPRALALEPEAVVASADGSPYAIEPLTSAEREGLIRRLPPDAPAPVLGDFPDWLEPSLRRVFGESAVLQGEGLARRAPVDLRVNLLKSTRERVLKGLERFAPVPTPLSPLGVRLPVRDDGPARHPNVEVEAAHGKGWYEVQDEGSQLAALLAEVGPRQQVLDICAGGGGKTLAFGGAMQNTGQIYAYDNDAARLRPIFDRLKRAGVRNAQVLRAGDTAALTALGPRFDVVYCDAPCTGSGAWRRRPDAKWRLKPANLVQRVVEQRAILALAAPLVKPGGRLVYVTCSVLAEENGEQVAWFLENHPQFAALSWVDAWSKAIGSEPPASAGDAPQGGLLLTPASHGTDGFFVGIMWRPVLPK